MTGDSNYYNTNDTMDGKADVSLSSSCSDNNDDHPDYHEGGSSNSGETKTEPTDSSKEQIGYEENKVVRRSKLLVYLVLLITALGTGLVTFFLTVRQETNEFEHEFESFANELVRVSHTKIQTYFDASESVAATVTAYATDRQDDFPFVTLPRFEAIARKARDLTGCTVVALCPLVAKDPAMVDQWANYTQQHQGWIRQGLDLQGLPHVDPGPIHPNVISLSETIDIGGKSTAEHDEHEDHDQHDEHEDHNDTGHDEEDYHEAGHDEEENHGEGHHDEEDHDDHDDNGRAYVFPIEDYILPYWQMSPAPINASVVNVDVLSDRTFILTALESILLQIPFLTNLVEMNGLYKFFSPESLDDLDHNHRRTLENDHDEDHGREHDEDHDDDHDDDHDEDHQDEDNKAVVLDRSPHTVLFQPVLNSLEPKVEKQVVSFILMISPWDHHFQGILPAGTPRIDAVLTDSCGSTYTYSLAGTSAFLRGRGDLHDTRFSHLVVETKLGENQEAAEAFEGQTGHDHEHCVYRLFVYPTVEFEDEHKSKNPFIYSAGIVCVFLFTATVFVIYDFAVQKRQNTVLRSAKQTQAIVASIFPENVHHRILQSKESGLSSNANNKTKLSNFLNGNGNGQGDEKPIADLFPSATIIFADIAGFTSWSSTREPSQVFRLLESVYLAFDTLAKRRKVFKIETIGDCYVAVVGVPEAQANHAILMARFARDCLAKFNSLVKQLVVELGPDTEELGLRVGLHSGSVTAGVLRGERARFQLFGDTVNVAARMEQTGLPNKIQISQETADLLIAAGKSAWCNPRVERILAKGKGELSTYWLDAKTRRQSSESVISNSESNCSSESALPQSAFDPRSIDGKTERLVQWNTDILLALLKQIIARRQSAGVVPDSPSLIKSLEDELNENQQVLDEVQVIIALPQFDDKHETIDPSTIELSDNVKKQAEDYVRTLASMYRQRNPFHNFEHASHVTMSVTKLLSRIVAPDLDSQSLATLHDHTYGITSDPLTQFSVVLSALIHDVDHPGVPNAQLVEEGCTLASFYNGKSIAEQNSVVLSWHLLMDDRYKDLRQAIYVTKTDLVRFRVLLVNIVMATDIMDKDLKTLRNKRWDSAFHSDPAAEAAAATHGTKEDTRSRAAMSRNRKATIVMEHLMQASDVAHTMQHWHIYRKWNERLFAEMYAAYAAGRSTQNPAENWYEGEKGFFDFYIIPLAKKLQDCGVFGVSSHEYLQYALQNRKEWETKGQSIVAAMMERLASKLTVTAATSEILDKKEDEQEHGSNKSCTTTTAQEGNASVASF